MEDAMETITIPSPSAFLRASSPVQTAEAPPDPEPKRRPSAPKQQSVAAAAAKKNAVGVTKPKQSKSRNGTCGSPLVGLSAVVWWWAWWSCEGHELTVRRLYNVQGQTIKVRRDEAVVSAMSQEERHLRGL